MGLKRADCLLAQQSSSQEFMRVTSEPPIPKRRPDLTTFIHKPLEVRYFIFTVYYKNGDDRR